MTEWHDEEMVNAFKIISAQYYNRNFGKLSKADFEVIMFSIYIEHLLKNGQHHDDYSIAVQLGIPETRVRNLKVKKELQYPYAEYNWKKAFIERISFAKYDDKKALVKVSIPDPNVRRDIEHYIDEMNWYSEYQLNAKLLQMRADQFVDLCICINKEYAKESKDVLDTEQDIRKRLKQCRASEWIDNEGIVLIDKIKTEGISNCLGDIVKAGSKVGLKVALNAVPIPASCRPFFENFIDSL